MIERGHGRASRLLLEGVDTSALDAVLDSGGEGAAAARLGMAYTFTGPNRLGRMFPRARRFRPANESLVALAEGLRQETQTDPTPDADDNKQVPAGFTYFGQFVDHDITLDPTVGFPPVEDPENFESLRTPRLELDSVYGMGPVVDPAVLSDIGANGRKFYDFSGPPFDGTPYMPVEFSLATYRMVRHRCLAGQSQAAHRRRGTIRPLARTEYLRAPWRSHHTGIGHHGRVT